MALKKQRDDAFDKVKQEAEEAGINLSRAEDGTFTAFAVGLGTIDGYSTPQEAVDDMLAIQEMSEKDDLYSYDNGPMGGYQVSITGVEKPFEDASLAGAFAQAKASLIPAVKTAEKRIGTAKVRSGPELSPHEPVVAQIEAKDDEAMHAKEEAEILSPTRPNGAERAQMKRDDLAEVLAQGYLDLASLLTNFATSLRANPGTIPFVQQGFTEGEPAEETEAPPPARSRITRERRGK